MSSAADEDADGPALVGSPRCRLFRSRAQPEPRGRRSLGRGRPVPPERRRTAPVKADVPAVLPVSNLRLAALAWTSGT